MERGRTSPPGRVERRTCLTLHPDEQTAEETAAFPVPPPTAAEPKSRLWRRIHPTREVKVANCPAVFPGWLPAALQGVVLSKDLSACAGVNLEPVIWLLRLQRLGRIGWPSVTPPTKHPGSPHASALGATRPRPNISSAPRHFISLQPFETHTNLQNNYLLCSLCARIYKDAQRKKKHSFWNMTVTSHPCRSLPG